MRANDQNGKTPLRNRWTDWLSRWLRSAEETPEAGANAGPTTAASQTMRERIDEPRD